MVAIAAASGPARRSAEPREPPLSSDPADAAPSGARPTASRRVLQEWAARVRAEYTSAATTARLVHLAIGLGLPEELVLRGLDIVRDELAHARLSHECLHALGGEDEPVPLGLEELLPSPTEGALAEATTLVLRAFCFGETLAVPLFQALRETCTHPAARPVLDRVLRDEARHRAYGWDVLDALMELDPEGVRALARDRLGGIQEAFRASYGRFPAQPRPLSDTERAMGLMPASRWAAVFERALTEDVAPRLARRGLRLLPFGPPA
jgi:hypothetical protein